MGAAASRVDVLENLTDAKIEIKEMLSGLGYSNYDIKLSSGERKEISATKFSRRKDFIGVASHLKIFLNEEDTNLILLPHHFINYGKIVFSYNTNRQLEISGTHSKLLDLGRIRFFGFLGREYQNRTSKVIT